MISTIKIERNQFTDEKTAKILLVGDSMISGINERRITQKNNVKVSFFQGATT